MTSARLALNSSSRPGTAAKAAVPVAPVAHRGVEQHHLQPVGAQPGRQFPWWEIIGHLKFHRPETGGGSSFKAFEERQLGKKVMQVRRKSGHEDLP